MPGTEGCKTELGANIDLSHILSAHKITVTLQINASSISPVAPGPVFALASTHLPTLSIQQAEPSSVLLCPWPQQELLQQLTPAPIPLTRCSKEEEAQALGAKRLVPRHGQSDRQSRQACRARPHRTGCWVLSRLPILSRLLKPLSWLLGCPLLGFLGAHCLAPQWLVNL